MNPVLLALGSVFAVMASVLHFVIFYLESFAWAQPQTWRRFGLRSQDEADTVKPMAYNQGWYNGFLAVGALVGVVLLTFSTATEGGYAVTLFAVLSMLTAAVVLILSSPQLARAALTQGAFPLLSALFLLLALAF
jgi:putative membrane protein